MPSIQGEVIGYQSYAPIASAIGTVKVPDVELGPALVTCPPVDDEAPQVVVDLRSSWISAPDHEVCIQIEVLFMDEEIELGGHLTCTRRKGRLPVRRDRREPACCRGQGRPGWNPTRCANFHRKLR